uniref:Uncharacterized protein n=1 Tax=Sphaerodactylus townsendi TaxID=933632 RepID=A0ACB8FLI4_9SAUR
MSVSVTFGFSVFSCCCRFHCYYCRSREVDSNLTAVVCFAPQNVMEQFNPGLRNLINLGKNYEKAVNGPSYTILTLHDVAQDNRQ